jgi:hypothetical protein
VPEQNPKQSIPRPKLRAFSSARQRGQLLPQRDVLERDSSVPSTEQSDGSEEYDDRRQHARSCRASALKINPARSAIR